MKIAFLSSLNPARMTSWSGTLYFIYRSLQRKHEVCWIGPETLYDLQVLYRLQQGEGKSFDKEKYCRKVGKLLSEKIGRADYDLVFARDFSFIAYLDVRVPVVYLADTTFRQLNGFFQWPESFVRCAEHCERRAIGQADRILYSSEWARDGAVGFYGAAPEKIRVVEFGANLPEEVGGRTGGRSKPACCNLLFVGRPWWAKGGPKAYEAYRMLRDSHFDCSLTIVGCEPEDYDASDPAVRVYPFLDKSKSGDWAVLKACYEQAAFLILPTEFDCFGIVFAEASAFGVPALAADAGGVSQAVRPGANGFLLPPEAAPADYAGLIRAVYADDDRYRALCVSARQEYERRLNWDVWFRKTDRILQETVSNFKTNTMTDDLYIPAYAINLKSREDRRKHILNEFRDKPEFQLTLVEACEHPIGAVGLWNSIRKIVSDAVEKDHDVILICEDDHCFTSDYSREFMFENIMNACRQGAEILNGGVGGFGMAVPVAENRYWVDWFWCTQFIFIYSEMFQRILDYEFRETDTADGVLSALSDNKMVVYPFLSRQMTFGYSDITASNKEDPDLIVRLFERADRRMNVVHAISKHYNFPWNE